MQLSYKSLPFRDVKAEGDGSTFGGYCAAFHNCDSYGDVITPGAFKATLPEFLSDGQILYDHGELIGKPVEAAEDEKGLRIKGVISDTARGRDVKTLLKDGVLRKMSIGYMGTARKPTNQDDVKAYWKAVGYEPTAEDLFNLDYNKNCLSFLSGIKLYEASPVRFPANTQADITDVKGLQGLLRLSEVKGLLRDVKAGKTLSRATHATLKAVHDAIAPACKDLSDLLDRYDPDAGDDAGDAQGAAALKKARTDLLLLSADPLLVTR